MLFCLGVIKATLGKPEMRIVLPVNSFHTVSK